MRFNQSARRVMLSLLVALLLGAFAIVAFVALSKGMFDEDRGKMIDAAMLEIDESMNSSPVGYGGDDDPLRYFAPRGGPSNISSRAIDVSVIDANLNGDEGEVVVNVMKQHYSNGKPSNIIYDKVQLRMSKSGESWNISDVFVPL